MRARAVVIREPGEVETLEIREVEAREPGYGEVRVAVAAAGVNRADLMQRRGLYAAPPGVPSDIPGLEYAGVIERVGEGVRGASLGDRVMGITGGGAMCTHVVVHHRETMGVPEGMPLVEAAAIPEVFITAWDALLGQAGLSAGEACLVHAAASGVGTAAIQLAVLAGARVIGTARSAEKLARVAPLGLDAQLVPSEGSFASEVLALTRGDGVDVVLDPVGARYFADNLCSLRPLGRLVMIGFMGGARGEISLTEVLTRRLRLIGTTLRARPLEEKIRLAQEFARTMVPLFVSGRLRPIIDAVLPISEVRAAHARMERNENVGKLILTW